jgi:Holliday junction DNA helicase RuvB
VGIEAIASTLQIETDVLLDVIEPYLLKSGFVIRTSQGRKATDMAYTHLNIAQHKGPNLFDSAKTKRHSQ